MCASSCPLSAMCVSLRMFQLSYCHVCFHCVSYAHFLSPTLRRQLGAQSDVFHWPIDASSPNCGAPSKADHEVQAHICTKHNLCVTLSPNTANLHRRPNQTNLNVHHLRAIYEISGLLTHRSMHASYQSICTRIPTYCLIINISGCCNMTHFLERDLHCFHVPFFFRYVICLSKIELCTSLLLCGSLNLVLVKTGVENISEDYESLSLKEPSSLPIENCSGKVGK
ncbi:unnamed protein product [Toxocara canis]|uniref:Secreted protein n=1 Tax=Toxocara canis TaxID=6265 RepID=A0A183U018_TOXCA|nr:unnamed protein product [Toxocara canis]